MNTKPQTWLICGGRAFSNRDAFDGAMSVFIECRGRPNLVIHGAASGADQMADDWARRLAIDVLPMPADWSLGKSGGPLRNQRMIAQRPRLVIAFPGGKGTADVVRRAQRAGIEVIQFQPRSVR